MKARIAKLEGENRASKRLQQGSEARIKMLEMALKRERCVIIPQTLHAAPLWPQGGGAGGAILGMV